MEQCARIVIRGIVQGVGFRPFVYAAAQEYGIRGVVRNTGSEVEINACGDRLDEFAIALAGGTKLSRIDSISVEKLPDNSLLNYDDFRIAVSGRGNLSGFIPCDVSICEDCIGDIFDKNSRYNGYWATSCVNCGPRYSIIGMLPYDREHTSMKEFPMCNGCSSEFTDPSCRRHHAQTIACHDCGPGLALLDANGRNTSSKDPAGDTARLLDSGCIVAIRGIGGFHIACIEESARKLKQRLGRTEQPLAVMGMPDTIREIAEVSEDESICLERPERPIVVLEKKNFRSHSDISNLHTIGCMLPYTGLHYLLFSRMKNTMLIMTSANIPGYPMVTETDDAIRRLGEHVDYILTHDRQIINRIDDSVVRNGYIIRLSRGLAPMRTAIELGSPAILGVGPEMNSNVSIYNNGFIITSPHVGNVRNPQTFSYLKETEEKIRGLTGADYGIIAHDAHPAFLSTRYARELSEETGAELVPVQHHRAHIAAATTDECVGIAIDGVGYGDDETVWGGEVFAGAVPHLERVAHIEYLPMPGGDIATKKPERMLFGILDETDLRELLSGRGWTDTEINIIYRQIDRNINISSTTSTGRVLDAASSLLGICRERTYDGEPAMKLESAAVSGMPSEWDLEFEDKNGMQILSTRAIVRKAFREMISIGETGETDRSRKISDIAASVQYNIARGIAGMAINTAGERGIDKVALSGGVAYNFAIRETIRRSVEDAGLEFVINRSYPPGDGCISYGQCVYAGLLKMHE